MRVLVACEFSGIVRDAFVEHGHDAWSCDLMMTERPGNHIEADVLDIISDDWDLMIAHPPCRYLSSVGNRWFYCEERREKRRLAFDFFMSLYNAPIPRVAVENPTGYVNSRLRKPDQIVHPYYFGDPEMKRTCLWLRNLPSLMWHKENDLLFTRTMTEKPKPVCYDQSGKARYRLDFLAGSKDRWKKRSRFWPGIAKAMAEQWGSLNK